MRIKKALTMYRCEMNRIHLDTSLRTLAEQEQILDNCLADDVNFQKVKAELNRAMEKADYDGFTDELENLLRKDEQIRGHDYLKLWMKTYFVFAHGANYIIADTASHDMLQNKLNFDQKAELIRMMRGAKHEPRGHVNIN